MENYPSVLLQPVSRLCGQGQAPGAHACLKSGFPSLDLSRSFSALLIKKPISLRVEMLIFFFARYSPDSASITRLEIKLAENGQCYNSLLFLSQW